MDINQMVDDIFEQDQPKKKINDLRDLEKYNPKFTKSQQNTAEDNFDILYRTPQNITVKDLIPKDYTVITNPIGTRFENLPERTKGYYDPKTDKIYIRDEEYFNKTDKPELLQYNNQERILMHEATHRTQRNRSNEVPLVKSEYNYFKDTSPLNTNELTNNINLFKEQLKRNDINISPKNFEKLEKSPKEFLPVFTQFFPEQVINPRNKLAKKANRLWFD